MALVKDYFSYARVREHVLIANRKYDGPGEVGYVLDPGETMPRLQTVEWAGVGIPGDGRPFPVRSVALALWRSEVVKVRS